MKEQEVGVYEPSDEMNASSRSPQDQDQLRIQGHPNMTPLPSLRKCEVRRSQSNKLENLNLTAEAMAVLLNDSLIDSTTSKRKGRKQQTKKNWNLTAEAMAILSN